MRALIEDGLPGANIAQVGLASFANSRSMHEDAIAAGNLVDHHRRRPAATESSARSSARSTHVAHCEAIVVDCDIDVIDRSQFPAAPGRAAGRNGGRRTSSRRCAGSRPTPRVRVIDLTEWDPPLDPTDLSALTAARWVAECLAGYEMR